ncbi:MAG: hypothetical protein AAF556_00265 [Pseudomonadota bacterium]
MPTDVSHADLTQADLTQADLTQAEPLPSDQGRSGLRLFGNERDAQTEQRLGVGRRGRISQRLLILHRWIAVIGQAIAVITVHFGMGYDLPLIPALLLVGASAVLNLVVMAQRGRPTRLDDRSASLYLAFDILQLSALLYLTGGLQNPFAVLMLAPVTVAATMLGRQAVFSVVGLAFCVLACWRCGTNPCPDLTAFPGSFHRFIWSGFGPHWSSAAFLSAPMST